MHPICANSRFALVVQMPHCGHRLQKFSDSCFLLLAYPTIVLASIVFLSFQNATLQLIVVTVQGGNCPSWLFFQIGIVPMGLGRVTIVQVHSIFSVKNVCRESSGVFVLQEIVRKLSGNHMECMFLILLYFLCILLIVLFVFLLRSL